MSGPLSGIRVIDFGRYAVAPPAGMYLGQLGAEVIKVESPTGDNSRNIPPLKQGVSVVYMTVNSNKKNILLDLRNPEDHAVAVNLAAMADVVLENFRPGVMENLRLGYADVAATNPGVVYCSASGFGSRGPMKLLGSTDHFGQAMGGFMALNGEPGGRAQFLRQGGFVDISTTQRMVQAVLAGLYVRQLTGRGQKVETSQFEAAVGLVATRAAEYFATSVVPGPLGSASGVCAPSQAFQAADTRYVCLSAETPAQWRSLCAALGRPALADEPRFADNASRVENREALAAALQSIIATQPAETWEAALQAAGVPCFLHWNSETYAPLKADAHVVETGLFESLETPWGAVNALRPPWRFSATPAFMTRSPGLDEHAAEIRHLAATGAKRGSQVESRGEQPDGKPFAGLRVVEYAQGYAAPACAMFFGDLGANVIKVEPPAGDYTRRLGPQVGGESALYLSLNRSKRGVVLDPSSVEGHAALQRLAAGADVFITDLLPENAAAQGIDYATLRDLNPKLVYCSITPFGETGPRSRQLGSELVLQESAGVLRFLGSLKEAPLRLGADAAGATTAVYASIGIVAALLHALWTGEGQKVAVDQQLSLLNTQCSQIVRESDPDEWSGTLLAPMEPPEYPYATADTPVHAGIRLGSPDEAFQAFLRGLGLDALCDDPRFAEVAERQKNGRELMRLLAERFKQLPSVQVLPLVHALGGNAVPCHSFATLFEDEQTRAMGLVVQLDDPELGKLRGINVPLALTGTPFRIERPAPRLGEHTAAVLAELDGQGVTAPAS